MCSQGTGGIFEVCWNSRGDKVSPGNERFVKSTVCSTQGRGKCERRDGVRAGPEEVGVGSDGAVGRARDGALRAETVLQIVTLVYILTFYSSVQFYCNDKNIPFNDGLNICLCKFISAVNCHVI